MPPFYTHGNMLDYNAPGSEPGFNSDQQPAYDASSPANQKRPGSVVRLNDSDDEDQVKIEQLPAERNAKRARFNGSFAVTHTTPFLLGTPFSTAPSPTAFSSHIFPSALESMHMPSPNLPFSAQGQPREPPQAALIVGPDEIACYRDEFEAQSQSMSDDHIRHLIRKSKKEQLMSHNQNNAPNPPSSNLMSSSPNNTGGHEPQHAPALSRLNHLACADSVETTVDDLAQTERQAFLSAVDARKYICVSGQAGTWKSGLLQYTKDKLTGEGRRAAVLTFTRACALSVGGQTIHKFASLPSCATSDLPIREDLKEALVNVDVVFIENTSSVPEDIFERLSKRMCAARGTPDKLLGGAQLIAFGDYGQLRPTHGGQQSALCSSLWSKSDFVYILLTNNYRQTDPELLAILRKLWLDQPLTADDKDRLTSPKSDCSEENAVRLFSNKCDAKRHNTRLDEKHLRQSNWYECLDKVKRGEADRDKEGKEDGKFKRVGKSGPKNLQLHKFKDHNYQVLLRLKIGMPVMLLTSISLDKIVVAGSQGTITGFWAYDNAELSLDRFMDATGRLHGKAFRAPKQQEYLEERLEKIGNFMSEGEYHLLPVVKFDYHPREVVVWPDCALKLGAGKQSAHITRTQIPLQSCLGMRINQSQGKTFDRVVVDLNIKHKGEAYAAFSRARLLPGFRFFTGLSRTISSAWTGTSRNFTKRSLESAIPKRGEVEASGELRRR